VYREELIKYFGWHDLFVLWRVVIQEDAGVPGGVLHHHPAPPGEVPRLQAQGRPSRSCHLKVHTNENFFGFDFEICTFS
jgi:hypothetical protein